MKSIATTTSFLLALAFLLTPAVASAQSFETGTLDDYDWQLRNDTEFGNVSTIGGITDAFGGSDGERSVEVTNDSDQPEGALINDEVEVDAGDMISFDVLVPQQEIDNNTFEFIQPFVQCNGFSGDAQSFGGTPGPQDFAAGEYTTLSVAAPENCETTSRVGIQIVNNSDETATPTMYVDNIRNQNGEALPVELAAFDASVSGSDVTLRWRTASEVNNAGFRVQQQTEGAWGEVAFVKGSGTTSAPQTYSRTLSGLSAGAYTFRLQQVDYDGTTALGPEVEVTVGTGGAYTLSSPYPNPTAGQASFDLTVSQAQAVTVELFNTLGQRVEVLHDGPLAAGSAQAFTVDAGELASGVYFVRARGESFSASRQLVLVK